VTVCLFVFYRQTLSHFGGATEKVVVLGNTLLKEASIIIKEWVSQIVNYLN